MDKLVLERTQPMQGQPVDVAVVWNGEAVGELHFEFKAWLKFKKLLEKGLEMDAREDHALDLKLTVKGREGVAKTTPYERSTIAQPIAYQGSVSNLAAEDDEDAEDLAAIAAAEAGAMPVTNPAPEADNGEITQGLIRSLRRENADG